LHKEQTSLVPQIPFIPLPAQTRKAAAGTKTTQKTKNPFPKEEVSKICYFLTILLIAKILVLRV
jgi:hypothetical protein